MATVHVKVLCREYFEQFILPNFAYFNWVESTPSESEGVTDANELTVGDAGLYWEGSMVGGPVRVQVDFCSASMHYRRTKTLGKKQPLFRALGRVNAESRVIDITSGLGGDDFLMASMGYEVVGYEQNPVVHALAKDGWLRAGQFAQMQEDLELSKVLARMDFRWGAGERALENFVGGEIVFIDPMFPEKKRGAKSSKELELLKRLVGVENELQSQNLVKKALASAASRVIVKRPLKAAPLSPGKNHSYEGKSIRYDMYHLAVKD